MKSLVAREALLLVTAGLLLGVVPLVAPSVGFATALLVFILGSGRALPGLLFGTAWITSVEAIFLMLVGGLGIALVTLFVVLQAGIEWNRENLVMVGMGLTLVGSLMNAIALRRSRDTSPPRPTPPTLIAFMIGAALPIVGFLALMQISRLLGG